MQNNEIAASQDRAKVSIGAGPRRQTAPNTRPLKSMKSHEMRQIRMVSDIFGKPLHHAMAPGHPNGSSDFSKNQGLQVQVTSAKIHSGKRHPNTI